MASNLVGFQPAPGGFKSCGAWLHLKVVLAPPSTVLWTVVLDGGPGLHPGHQVGRRVDLVHRHGKPAAWSERVAARETAGVLSTV